MDQFKIGNDKFKVESLVFSGGKKRIKANGTKVFEGIMSPDKPVRFEYGGQQYELQQDKEAGAFRVKVTMGDTIVHDGLFNAVGIDVSNPDNANKAKKAQAVALVFALAGFLFFVGGNILTNGLIMPGGALGGGLGVGVGGAIGMAIGKALFVRS